MSYHRYIIFTIYHFSSCFISPVVYSPGTFLPRNLALWNVLKIVPWPLPFPSVSKYCGDKNHTVDQFCFLLILWLCWICPDIKVEDLWIISKFYPRVFKTSDAEHHGSPLLGGKCWLVLNQHSKYIVGWQPWYIRPLMLKTKKTFFFFPQSKGTALTLHMMDFRWVFQNCMIVMQRRRGVGQIVNTGPQQIGVFLYPCVV